MNTSFFGELLQTISDRGRSLIELASKRRAAPASHAEGLVELCEDLLSRRGEASGVALARDILARYAEMTTGPRIGFFEALATRFATDRDRLAAAVERWRQDPTDDAIANLRQAAEPRRQELLRRLNLAPGGTAELVAMREQLLDAMKHRDDLNVVDDDFVHLFSSWFNRGFLVLRRIDWGAPAIVLEKIIRYEAVHRIRGWDDLRRRIDPRDRRCYAFFHPALVDDPLIFVEVAFTREIPSSISSILTGQRDVIEPEKATTAVFYSISNCQRGLAGVSFGHFLIKQVAEEISREIPNISNFVTLSPAPGFGAWLTRERQQTDSTMLTAQDRAALVHLDTQGWWQMTHLREAVQDALCHASACYFLQARNKRGTPVDPVARFHLGNGARLEQINLLGDTSSKGMSQSYGLMVNYLYDLKNIERNHEAYAENRTIVASSGVKKLARGRLRELMPAVD